MVNGELINNLRENTKMSFNQKIFGFFMNQYINQDMSTYSSNNGESLFDFIRINGSNASNMNQEDYKKLILKLINKSIEVAKQKNIQLTNQELTMKLLNGLNRRKGKLTFDSEELFGEKIEGEKNIFFYLDVDGKDIISVLNDIIDKMDANGVAYDITIPDANEIVKGHTDAITLAVSPESYITTVDTLESVSEETKAKAKDNDYARANWFGVNTVVDGVAADTLIGKLFIQGMNDVLTDEVNKYPELTFEATDASRQHAYNEIIKSDATLEDRIYARIVELIKQNGLDPDNMFVYNSVNEQLDKLYKNNEAPVAQVVGDEVPLDEAISEFVKSLDEAKEVPSVGSMLTPDEINKIDSKLETPTASDSIVDDTMEMVGQEVKEIIKDTPSVDESQILASDTIVSLSPEEKQAMNVALDKTQESLNLENKYLGLLDGVEGWTLDSLVKDENGNDITLLDFLEKNNTLEKIPFNSVVTLLDPTTEDGVSISGKKFISKYVLDTLKINQTNPVSPGGLTLEEIMERYIDKIEVEDIGIIYPEGLTAPVKSGGNIFKKLGLFKKK